eukprot:GFKZ01011690.1.p1 GENE.GFKZ01011690.1~~GFKZ01011690.1.p1  ORF type:complete len:376 (-),score=48.56 GFKZ01011690.1:175-1209(-)
MERFRKLGTHGSAHKGGVWTLCRTGGADRDNMGDFITSGCDFKLRTWRIKSDQALTQEAEVDEIKSDSTSPLTPVGVFSGHSLPVVSVAVAKEGSTGVSVSLDGCMRVWNVSNADADSKVIQQMNIAEMWGVDISENGERAVTGGVNGTVKVVDTKHGVVDETYSTGQSGEGGGGSRREKAMVMSVGLNQGGTQVATGSHDGGVKVLDLETGRVVGGKLARHGGAVRSVRFLEAVGEMLVTGADDGLIHLYDVRSGHLTGCCRGHSGMVFSVDASGDGRYLVSGGSDRCVRVWDRGTKEEVYCFKGHKDSVWGVGYVGRGENIVSVSDDGQICVLDSSNADTVA